MINTWAVWKNILNKAIRGSLTNGDTSIISSNTSDVRASREMPRPFEIPFDWKWMQLGELFQHNTGKALNAADTEGEPFEYITTSNVYWGRFELDDLKQMMFKDSEAEKCTVRKGDLLVCEGGDIGRSAIWDRDYDIKIQNHIHRLRPISETTIAEFYFYVLWAYKLNGWIGGRGIGLQGLSSRRLHALIVPVPPVEQQRQLASILSKADEYIQAIGITQKEYVRDYQSLQCKVIEAGINGNLTIDWRREHDVIQDETWSKCKLIDVLKAKPRNGFSAKPVDYETPYRNLALSAVTSGVFRPEYYKYIEADIPEDSHLWLMPGDILLQRSNSLERVGTSALYTGGSREYIYPDLMMKLQVNERAYAPFIAYQLKRRSVMEYLRSHATGTAGNMPKVNQRTVSSIPIVLPGYEEQVVIADMLDKIFSIDDSDEMTGDSLEGVAI